MQAAPPERSRTEERMRSYGRTVRRAFLLAAALHVAVVVAVNPSLVLRLFRPRPLIGYPGEPRPGDLASEGIPGRHGVSVFRARRLAGPATLIPLEITRPEPAAPAAPPSRSGSGVFEPVSGETPPPSRSGSGGRGGGIQFELDENGSVIGGSANVARSERFQTLKIVRPTYPRSAIRAGIEGLVRLEVQVDTAGRVVEVRTDENTTSNREMEDAAIRAMQLWEFKPYVQRSRPVPFTLIVPFRYRLVD